MWSEPWPSSPPGPPVNRHASPCLVAPVPAILSFRRLTALLAGAVALPLALGACASSSTVGSTTTTGATRQQRTASVCSLVTVAQIERTVGKTVDAPQVADSTRLTVCSYPSKIPAAAVIVGLRAMVTEPDAGLEQARLGKLHGSLTDALGQGFRARGYSETSVKPTVIGLVNINGRTQVTMAWTSPLARQELLTQQIFATLAAQATGASTTSTTSTAAAP
jgi:hypothetical protein